MTPALSIPAARSTSPDPQIPRAGVSPMVWYSTRWLMRTASMAPSAARIPQDSCAPSKAGPAAVEQATRRSREPSAISPFVPMSMARAGSVWVCRAVARITAVVSAPTQPAMFGSTHTTAFGYTFSPASAPRSRSAAVTTGTYGARASASGLMPRKR